MKLNLNEVVTIDFETYYDSKYSLRAKVYNTSSYIMDPQFQIHCCAIKIGTKKSKCYWGREAVEKALKAIDWTKHDLLAHNNFFDGAIAKWHLGIKPRRRFCTVQMTRGLHSDMSKASLDAICKFYGIGGKISGLEDVKGTRTEDIPKDKAARLMEYCNNDNEKCFEVFKKQIAVYPEREIQLIDITLSMFCDPVFQLDVARAEKSLNYEMNERLKFIAISRHDEKTLTSTPKFVAALEALGVKAPQKISKRTGQVSYALSETDEEFIALQEHEDIRVVRLVQGRLAAKSTMMETRAWRMLQAQEMCHSLPVLLNYFGAKTGRWSGGNKMNFQNLPTSTKDFPMAGELRKAILAPPGHVLIAPDSSQIEARTVAWVSGHEALLERFRNKEDVYKWMAGMIYGIDPSEVDSEQRFIGKLCLAEGTLIYSNRGWIPIETLRETDLLWDGDSWVCHNGLLKNGCKETLSLSGLWLTPDHLVWSGTEWREAQSLAQDERTLCQALDIAAASSPLQAMCEGFGEVLKRSSSAAIADGLSTPSIVRISRISKVLGAICARSKLRLASAIGSTLKQCQRMSIGLGYLTASQRLLPGVTHLAPNTTYIMEHGKFRCLTAGEKIVLHFCRTYERFLDGMIQSLSWTGSILTGGMRRETFDLLPGLQTPQTNEGSPASRRKCDVYDVLSVGPKNRFLALSDRGPLLVHNCVLGLGYGMGAKRFQTTLALGVMGPPVQMSMTECSRIVKMYRKINQAIVEFWRECENVLEAMTRGESGSFGPGGILQYEGTSIWLPNGMGLHYPGLRALWNPNTNQIQGFKYKSNGADKHIYGGLLCENIVQALAGVIIREEMVEVDNLYARTKLKKGEIAKIATMTHDEIVSVIPERLGQKLLDANLKIMKTPPAWAPDLPINAEAVGWATNYSI